MKHLFSNNRLSGSLFLTASLAVLMLCFACSEQTVVICQLSDPQLGFKTNNADFSFEAGNLEKAVGIVNAIGPDAVVFTGDLVHNPADSLQWEAFIRLASGLNDSLKVYCIPGNHDVLLSGGKADMTPFINNIGPDHFCTRIGKVLMAGMNSNLVKYSYGSEEERSQAAWIEQTLRDKPLGGISLLFSHHPFFLTARNEPEQYFNIRADIREEYLTLFESVRLDGMFCGHLHNNAEAGWSYFPEADDPGAAKADSTLMITTSAVGMPLGEAPSGMRIIVCDASGLHHRYFSLEEIPQDRKALIKAVVSQ